MSIVSSPFLVTLLVIKFLFAAMYAQAYQESITQNAIQWKHSYLQSSLTKSELATLVDLLLLSYQVAKASCTMIIAKLVMQQELYKIHTPSLLDSWRQNLQIEHNDTSKLEQALQSIKQCQKQLQETYSKFKSLASAIVHMNPQPTQTLIVDIKSGLIAWGKNQPHIPNQLLTVQNEFKDAIATISDIKSLFDTVLESNELKHAHLKEAASFFSKTYKDIELVVNHLTDVRLEGMMLIQEFFKNFFCTYYTMIYEHIESENLKPVSIVTTDNHHLPEPCMFFA